MPLALFLALQLSADPAALLPDLHSQAQHQPIETRMDTLRDLAIAATAADREASAQWAIEMYHLATDSLPRETNIEQMNRAAERKNALTILSLTDPLQASEHFLELEPSAAHLLLEDPRIDLARHLFPKLWGTQGAKSLPTIRRFCDFTSEHGQYPYVAMGHVLPLIAKVDPDAASSLFDAAVRHLNAERGIVRTQGDFLKFLREAWPVISLGQRRAALEAAVAALPHSTNKFRWHIEYYTPNGTVRLESEEAAHVYDLLPFIHAVDPSWEKKLRRHYPGLVDAPILPIDQKPWRAGAVATSLDRDTPERMQTALDESKLLFLSQWAAEDPKRAAAVGLSIKDPLRHRTALAILIQAYAKLDPAQSKAWLRELDETRDTMRGLPAGLLFRLNMSLGREAEAAVNLTVPEEARDATLTYGEINFNAAVDFIQEKCADNPSRATSLLAAAARGALRHAAGYEEPN